MSDLQTPAVPSDPDATLRPGSREQFQLPPAALPFLAPPKRRCDLGQLGPYRILRVLGQGNMGVVLQGEDPKLSRPVAIKVMLPELAARADARERFLREGRIAAGLQHDNIVTVYHVGEDQSVLYLVMPLLKGMSLDHYLKKGRPLSIHQVLRVGRDVARGLAAAHDHGLIHRDIKPGNLWLDAATGGRVKILDFGLARAEHSTNELTTSGMIVGTPAYMAPEQINGRPEARSDLYSLGAVLYKMLAGRVPFTDTDPLDLLVSVATLPAADVRSLAPTTPPELGALVMRLLAKKPDDRPATAHIVVEELKSISRGGSGQVDVSLVPLLANDDVATEEMAVRPRKRSPLLATPSEEPTPKPIHDAPTHTEARRPRPRRKKRPPSRWPLVAGLSTGIVVALVTLGVVVAQLWPHVLAGRSDAGVKEQLPPGILLPPEGFSALFDGKTLDTWSRLGPTSSMWQVRDGVIYCDGERGILQTTREFRDFELEVEWKAPAGVSGGVILRQVSLKPPFRVADGLEVFARDVSQSLLPTEQCGAVSRILAPLARPYTGAGKWQRYRIRCKGDQIRVTLNDTLIIDSQNQPGLAGIPREGRIGFHAAEGSGLEFRNVFLKDLR